MHELHRNDIKTILCTSCKTFHHINFVNFQSQIIACFTKHNIKHNIPFYIFQARIRYQSSLHSNWHPPLIQLSINSSFKQASINHKSFQELALLAAFFITFITATLFSPTLLHTIFFYFDPVHFSHSFHQTYIQKLQFFSPQLFQTTVWQIN